MLLLLLMLLTTDCRLPTADCTRLLLPTMLLFASRTVIKC